AALFTLGSYAAATPRLYGLSWGAEDLAAAVGASERRGEDGAWLPPYELARSLCLFAAAAAGVAAVDTVYTDYRDTRGLTRYAARARRDGFSGMLAIHPGQIDVINRAFVPTEAELERAERIAALFAQHPDAGALGLDGEMVDRPHLEQARRILELAKRLAAE
ncbi:MAG: aldolase/citrate lyase family protein, partial [Woeseiaceae bacterium]